MKVMDTAEDFMMNGNRQTVLDKLWNSIIAPTICVHEIPNSRWRPIWR